MPIPLGILAVAGAGAAGGGSAYDLLQTTVLSTTASDITFSSLGSFSSYKHLQLRVVPRSNFNSTVLIGFTIQLNSDTGANYAYHYLSGNGGTVSSVGSSASALDFHDTVPSNSSTTDVFGAAIIDFIDFSNTSKFKTIKGLGGATVASERWISVFSGLWRSTTAITSLRIIPDGGSFVAGSRFSIYGIR